MTGGALAADLPNTKGPPEFAPPPPPAFTWTGFYIGVNGGWAWGDTFDFYFNRTGTSAAEGIRGGFAGGTVGYNYEIAPNFVIGFEGDGDWADITGDRACPGPTFSCTTRVDALGSARGRLGWAWDRALLFVTGGVGIGDFRYNAFTTATGTSFGTPYNTTRVGWVVGAGVEYAITDNLSIKAEYDYYGFSGSTAPAGDLDSGTTYLRTDVQTGKVGLNWRFETWAPPAPVVAKY